MTTAKLSEIGYICRSRKWLAMELYPDKVVALIKYLYLKLQVKNELTEKLTDISHLEFTKTILDSLLKKIDIQKVRNKQELFFLLCCIETISTYEKERKIKFVSNSTITASDISSFTFCPASYAIGKSYYIFQNSKKAKGTKYHEATKLIDVISSDQVNLVGGEPRRSFINAKNKLFFDNISSAKLYYSGHSPHDKHRFFKNKNFVCQPDYIFVDAKGEYFVVEEKYKFSGDEECFFVNHQLQCASYIYGIDEIKIAYGYLIYWNTTYIEDEDGCRIPTVGCHAKKIERTSDIKELLISTFKEIQKFISTQLMNFNIETINIKKCTNCSVAAICGHKYAKFGSLKLPYYEGSYNTIQDIILPNELHRCKTALDYFFGKNLPCQICYKWLPPEELQSKYVIPTLYDEIFKRYTKFQLIDILPNENTKKVIDKTKFNFDHSSISFENSHDFFTYYSPVCFEDHVAPSEDSDTLEVIPQFGNIAQKSNTLDIIFQLGNVCHKCTSNKNFEVKIKQFEIKKLEDEILDIHFGDLNSNNSSDIDEEGMKIIFNLLKARKLAKTIELLEEMNSYETLILLAIAYCFNKNFEKSMHYIHKSQKIFGPQYIVFGILSRLNEENRNL